MAEKRDLARIFAGNIRRKRKQIGISQENLAERLEISQQSMSRMERGVMMPKFDRLPDIARELRCTVAELFVSAEETDDDTQMLLANLLQDLTETERTCVLRCLSEIVTLFKSVRAKGVLSPPSLRNVLFESDTSISVERGRIS